MDYVVATRLSIWVASNKRSTLGVGVRRCSAWFFYYVLFLVEWCGSLCKVFFETDF